MITGKTFLQTATLLAIGAAFICAPVTSVRADDQANRDAYERDINKDINDLQMKINEIKEDYKEDGVRVNQKIQEYQDKISEIKREADDRVANKDKYQDKADNDTFWGGVTTRVNDVRRNFHEWRLNRAINNYEEKINDLKYDAKYEVDAKKKLQLEEGTKKLEAKYDAAQAKLNDLRMTDGDNWDVIQKDLDNSLEEIDAEYDAVLKYM